MNRRRFNQVAVLIFLNLVFFLALDYVSPTPVIIKPVEEPASFTVEWEHMRSIHWEFYLVYSSEKQRETFLPIIQMLEDKKLGEYIRYDTEFIGSTYEEDEFIDDLQAAASMDIPWVIGGNTVEGISENKKYLNTSSIALISPYVSIDRERITSNRVLGMLPNSTEVARQYAQLLLGERLDYLIVLTNSSSDESLAAYYQQENGAVKTLSIDSGQQGMLKTLSQLETDTRIGIFIRQPSTEQSYLNDLGPYNITLYCENPNTLEIDTRVFMPESSSPTLYAEFTDLYKELTGENPSYADALLYDTCRILQDAVEIARYRPWYNTEAIWTSARRMSGVTGNCTLTAYGDRMNQEYVLEKITKGN